MARSYCNFHEMVLVVLRVNMFLGKGWSVHKDWCIGYRRTASQQRMPLMSYPSRNTVSALVPRTPLVFFLPRQLKVGRSGALVQPDAALFFTSPATPKGKGS